jgi:hypothetical protein
MSVHLDGFKPQHLFELNRVLREVHSTGLSLTPDEVVAAAQRILDVRLAHIWEEREKFPAGEDLDGASIVSRFTYEVLAEEFVELSSLWCRLEVLSSEEKRILANRP